MSEVTPADNEPPAAPTQEATQNNVEFNTLGEIAVAFYVPSILGHMVRAMVIAVLPLHLLELGYSYDDVGLLISFFGAGSMLSNVPAGKYASAYGPRALASAAFLLLVGAALCFVLASGFILLCSGSFLLGSGDAVGQLSRQMIISATVRKDSRGKFMSANGGVQRIAYTIAPFLGGLCAHLAGPMLVYALQAVFGLMAFAITCSLMPYIPIDQDISSKAGGQGQKAEKPKITMFSVLRHHWKTLFTVCIFVVCLSVLRRAREMYFSLVGFEIRLTQDQVGYIMSGSYALDALLFPVAGWLLDNIGRTRTGALSNICLSLSMIILLKQTWINFLLFSAFSGIGNGLSAGIVQVLGADLAPAECRGEFLALFRTFGKASDLLAPLIVGLVADLASLQLSELIVCGIGMFGACWVVCCIVEPLWDVPEKPIKAVKGGSNHVKNIDPKGLGKYAELHADNTKDEGELLEGGELNAIVSKSDRKDSIDDSIEIEVRSEDDKKEALESGELSSIIGKDSKTDDGLLENVSPTFQRFINDTE